MFVILYSFPTAIRNFTRQLNKIEQRQEQEMRKRKNETVIDYFSLVISFIN